MSTSYDPRTVTLVMCAMDVALKKYLSDDLRDEIWNTLAMRFPKEDNNNDIDSV